MFRGKRSCQHRDESYDDADDQLKPESVPEKLRILQKKVSDADAAEARCHNLQLLPAPGCLRGRETRQSLYQLSCW